MRKLLAVLPLAAVATALAVASAFGSSHTVTVKDNFFSPKTASIKKGSKVTWKWAGKVAHNVTFKTVHSKTQAKGTYSLTFNRKGTFGYRCTLHPGMTGSIKVA
jgi:plastocyanin